MDRGVSPLGRQCLRMDAGPMGSPARSACGMGGAALRASARGICVRRGALAVTKESRQRAVLPRAARCGGGNGTGGSYQPSRRNLWIRCPYADRGRYALLFSPCVLHLGADPGGDRPGVITTRQTITPAGVPTVFDGRVYAVAFGEDTATI